MCTNLKYNIRIKEEDLKVIVPFIPTVYVKGYTCNLEIRVKIIILKWSDNMKLNVLFLGKCDYERSFNIQNAILEKRKKDEISDTLILVEHPAVITLGKNNDDSNVMVSKEYLNSLNIELVKATRGGDVTYHGEGQIVGYTIVKLRELGGGIKKFVNNIEEVFIDLLKDKYNIDAKRDQEFTGVWVDDGKITAIGLSVSGGVTMHGFAFNVNTNLAHFDLIIPCGISDKKVTSIEKLIGKKANYNELVKDVIKYYCKIFDYDGFEMLSLEDLEEE